MAVTRSGERDLARRFDLRRLIGSGSFGSVYEAFDTWRNRTVALKTLARADAEAVARLKREFRSLAELRHPNLAALYELLAVGDEWALTMELVCGSDLLEHLSFAEIQSAFLEQSHPQAFDPDARVVVRRRRQEAKLSAAYLEHVRDAFRQLAEAIAFLHAHGVVHRDVKPSNAMMTAEGRVVLLDFGLVADAAADGPPDPKLIVGTPGYMSPEQIAMARPTPANDWYSFGVMLYQALTGRMPFTAANGADMIEQQLRGVATAASAVLPGLPEDLTSLADRCLSRDPAERPPASEILECLGSTLVAARGDARSHPRPAPLLGRSRESRALVRVGRSLLGEGRGVLRLHGMAGAGKSAIADPFLDELRTTTGAFIAGGRCRGWESLPLNAVDVIVDSVARAVREQASPEIEHALARSLSLVRLFPALGFASAVGADDETVLLPPTPAQAMARAAAELHELLAAIAGQRPVVLFLDDAQWGDYQSAEMFRLLLKARSPLRILLVLCYRSEDWRTSLLLQALGSSDVPQQELQLEPLSLAAMEKLALQSWRALPAAVRRAAVSEACGNPALLELMLHRGVGSLEQAVRAELSELSAAAGLVFDLLVRTGRPMAEEEIGEALELFASDEPLRALSRARLVRLRRTGDLLEADVYHAALRAAVG